MWEKVGCNLECNVTEVYCDADTRHVPVTRTCGMGGEDMPFWLLLAVWMK